MRDLAIWEFLADCLQRNEDAGFLIVVDSQGSSPGRRGFKMAVAVDGSMTGSIGGGIMEHKLVEYVLDKLEKGESFQELKRQIHSKEAAIHQSGMICSGEQTIALVTIHPSHLPEIQQLIYASGHQEKLRLAISDSTFRVLPFQPSDQAGPLKMRSQSDWSFEEIVGFMDVAHVIGAGHVGLEMCKILAGLDFFVVNYDDRPHLNTMASNEFANRKVVSPYSEIAKHIEPGENVYVIVMTFGYRGDDEAVRALLGKNFKYFGMMGSDAKVAKLLGDLRKDGYSESEIAAIRTPAGLVAHCKTPAEIAVSVGAEIVSVRNRKI